MPQTEVRLFRDGTGRVWLFDWLQDLHQKFPKVAEKCIARIAELAQYGNQMRRPACDQLRDGIWELRIQFQTQNYRMLYFFHGSHAVVVTHGLTKERAVPNKQIDLAIRCRELVRADPDKYTADWDD